MPRRTRPVRRCPRCKRDRRLRGSLCAGCIRAALTPAEHRIPERRLFELYAHDLVDRGLASEQILSPKWAPNRPTQREDHAA